MNESSSLGEYIPPLSPPWELATGIAATPMEALGGEFAIQCHHKAFYLTAVGGGGRRPMRFGHRRGDIGSLGEIHALGRQRDTSVLRVADGQRPLHHCSRRWRFTTDTIHSNATSIEAWEMFKLLPQFFPTYAIQTLRGFFLTAVGGGGHNSGDTIHTDAVNAAGWEYFDIFRSADFGTDRRTEFRHGVAPVVGGFLTATSGGNVPGGNASRPMRDHRSGSVGHCSSKTMAPTRCRQPAEGSSQQMVGGSREKVSVRTPKQTRSGTGRNSHCWTMVISLRTSKPMLERMSPPPPPSRSTR